MKPLLDASGRKYPFVNADEIEAARFPDEVGKHGLEAGRLAAEIRGQYIKEEQSFITETVFSHESKNRLVEDARGAGFEVTLNHIHVSSEELAYKRVRDRVGAGGHDVPRDKIFAHYGRTVHNIQKASVVADRTYAWDNSRQSDRASVTYRFVMTLAKGNIIKMAAPLPDWAHEMHRSRIEAFNKRR